MTYVGCLLYIAIESFPFLDSSGAKQELFWNPSIIYYSWCHGWVTAPLSCWSYVPIYQRI